MKKATMLCRFLELLIIPLIVFTLLSIPQQAQAQDDGYPEQAENFSREELAQMLAPIALYPDALLSQILMASTYPIEVIEADRWLRRNPGLQGEALDGALLDKDWDPSVKAICHFPSILALMSERITETTSLGNAFLAQEDEVMDMVQELRAGAYAQGNLTSTSRQTVIVEKETIVIEPANPRVIYVPYYDPFYIYGPWWYPAYPPYYWGPPGVSIGVGISYWPGVYFGFSYGNWCYFDWPRHIIFIDVHKRPRFVRHDRWIAKPGPWHHLPAHRRGVAYPGGFITRNHGQHRPSPGDFLHDSRRFPERRGLVRDRSRSGGERTRNDRDRQVRGNPDFERDRQGRERVGPEPRVGEGVSRERRERPIKDRDLERDRAGRGRGGEAVIERHRREGNRLEPDRHQRPRTVPERRAGERSGLERQQRQREKVLDQVESDSGKRLLKDRVRPGLQDQDRNLQDRNGDPDKRGRWGGANRNGGYDRGRNRR